MSEDSRMEAAIAAANWWAEAIGSPCFDNGDKSDTGGMTMMLAFLAADTQPVNSDSASKFAQLLAKAIHERLLKSNSNYGLTIGVDYGPDPILADAAKDAGVGGNRFPWKTNMWVRPDTVTVSAGYAAQTKLVWNAADWIHPICGANEWDDVKQEVSDEICNRLKYHEGAHGEFTIDSKVCVECGKTYAGHLNLSYEERAANRHEFSIENVNT